MKSALVFLLLSLYGIVAAADQQVNDAVQMSGSGGPLLREQAAYDVSFYHLDLTINPTSKAISGSLLARAWALDTLSCFVLHLWDNFTVDSVLWRATPLSQKKLAFTHRSGLLRIALPRLMQRGELLSAEIYYRGTPAVAINPPWGVGFVWKTTADGQPFASVACEEEGGDIWWPCKDHPSDEPDSMKLSFTVPARLTCVANGRLLGVTDNGMLKTYHWYVSNPINNYCVTFYLGPLQKIPVDYVSITGATIPAEYWFLPNNVAKARAMIPTFLKDLRFFEETCGPFPFMADKYAIVEAPYWGMEHQSAIAYANHFNLNSYGFDYIHLHELAHEWWGNLVTAKDWSDLWIHEGFATYMEALFVERMKGAALYNAYMAEKRPQDLEKPLAPNRSITAEEAYSADVYFGGMWVVHTLRYVVGDSVFFKLLRRLTYPDSINETVTSGKQCWLATTDDYLRIAEQISGQKLDWFFNVYLRQSGLPKLLVTQNGLSVTLTWSVQNHLDFPMPVEVLVGAEKRKIDMNTGTATITIPHNVTLTFDPDDRIFMIKKDPVRVEAATIAAPSTFAVSVYPNPFNMRTTLLIDWPQSGRIRADVYSRDGRWVQTVLNEHMNAGECRRTIDFTQPSSGIYFLQVNGAGYHMVKRLVLVK